MSWRRWRIAAAALLGLAATALLLRVLPARPLAQQIPLSSAVYADKGELLWLTLAADQQYRLWTPLDQVSPEYLQALRLYEDRHFGWHWGVDPAALLRATLATARGQRQGGSTLTMQLARMQYRLNTRTFTGKLRQMACAVWLELRHSKREILEAYVNVAPFGGNVQGVGAASLIYFGKTPGRLTFAESLTLAVIPQSPRARGSLGEESAALRTARLQLLREWIDRYGASQEAIAAASQTLSIGSRGQLPFTAPHLSTDLLADSRPGTSVHTTVDLALQRVLDRTVAQYIASVRDQGVTNAAALLVDTRSMAVRALVGSANFHDADIAGQVNAITARRSPGSALKPFIYGLAMDQGLIHTQTVLKDAPAAFGAYSPENFDGTFIGPVTAHDALIASRNVPAVGLSARLAQPSLYQFLKSAGVSRMASEKHYGLALALGGGEVSMEELAGLYAMLANDGLHAPIHYRAGEPKAQPLRLLTPEAAFMVRSILADNPRPDGMPAGRMAVAWKTGTSWGFRDAWSAGVFGQYVLIVWVGNFDGSSNPAFVGTRIAAPLFFRIVDALPTLRTGMPDRMLYPPPGVVQLEVCAASGDLPNADCPRRSRAWYIPGKSPIRVSTVHRRVATDTRTGLRACADTPARFVRSEVYEFWSSDLQRLFALAGMPRRRPPDDRCAGKAMTASTMPPDIVSPAVGVTYQLRSVRGESEVLHLNAIAGPEVRSLYWFADGAFLGSSSPSVPLAWRPARSGQIAVSVVDDAGSTATRTVRVAALQ
jgi:penicillin-binding protein 1C